MKIFRSLKLLAILRCLYSIFVSYMEFIKSALYVIAFYVLALFCTGIDKENFYFLSFDFIQSCQSQAFYMLLQVSLIIYVIRSLICFDDKGEAFILGLKPFYCMFYRLLLGICICIITFYACDAGILFLEKGIFLYIAVIMPFIFLVASLIRAYLLSYVSLKIPLKLKNYLSVLDDDVLVGVRINGILYGAYSVWQLLRSDKWYLNQVISSNDVIICRATFDKCLAHDSSIRHREDFDSIRAIQTEYMVFSIYTGVII